MIKHIILKPNGFIDGLNSANNLLSSLFVIGLLAVIIIGIGIFVYHEFIK